MKGVTITDTSADGGFLVVDLKDILCPLADYVRDCMWKVSEAEATGGSTEAFHRFSDETRNVSFDELLAAAEEVDQVIDGIFEAFPPCASEPTLRIEAVDSTSFDVYSEDDRILELMRIKFQSVATISE